MLPGFSLPTRKCITGKATLERGWQPSSARFHSWLFGPIAHHQTSTSDFILFVSFFRLHVYRLKAQTIMLCLTIPSFCFTPHMHKVLSSRRRERESLYLGRIGRCLIPRSGNGYLLSKASKVYISSPHLEINSINTHFSSHHTKPILFYFHPHIQSCIQIFYPSSYLPFLFSQQHPLSTCHSRNAPVVVPEMIKAAEL